MTVIDDEFWARMDAHLERRRQREKWYKPGIWMFWAAKRRARDAQLEARYAWQRVFRGWDDRAGWGTGHALAKTLGEQLVNMADIAHGHPPRYPERWNVVGDVQCMPDEPTESFNAWVGDLRRHGEALLAWHRGHHDIYDADEYTAILQPAQDALRWVADWLPTLWD